MTSSAAQPAPSDITSVLMVDDHPIVIQAVSNLLNREGSFTVRSATSGPEALTLYEQQRPDVVLTDISLDARMSGIELTQMITERDPDARVVCFTSFTDPENISAALDAGANGYLTKTTPPTDLAALLKDAARGLPVYDRKTSGTVVSLFRNRASLVPATLLTPRELEVVNLLCSEVINTRDIAATMMVAEQTVKSHLEKIYAKLGVTSKAQTIIRAFRTGLVAPEGKYHGPVGR